MNSHDAWLTDQLATIPDKLDRMSPSEFVEKYRYLPAHVSPFPGPYRFDINPMMREIVDCFDVRSDVREVNLMKGVQITYTTVAECVLFYAAAHLKTYPCQWLTDDDGNANKRMENNIIPMFVNSGMDYILQSNEGMNTRKQGVVKGRMSWSGGGFALVHGVQTGSKLRSDSIMFQVKDELDAWPLIVGKDGDPDKVSSDRCAAFWEDRKQFRGSTPLLMDTSKIYHQFLRGDQRHYFVKCHGCGHMQYLRWYGKNRETGLIYGIDWEMDNNGTLCQESVNYSCMECGHKHYEHDKTILFSPDHGAEWRPMADAKEPGIRSYKLPALYSPVGMQPWHKSVSTWLESWDVENNRPRNIGILQVFYNNVLAEPFEMVGDKLKLTTVSSHRRNTYKRGDIPNKWLEQHASSGVGLVVMTVDVQGSWLAVAIWGFTEGPRYGRMVLIDYVEIKGDTETSDAGAWVELREFIENDEWDSDDKKIYKPTITLIDANYRTDTVYAFCSQYAAGVFPIQGRATATSGAQFKEFTPYTTKLGTRGFTLFVDQYKDRASSLLKMQWAGVGEMPDGLFSAPYDIKDKELKHLTVEYKRKKKLTGTGQPNGFEWYRPGNARQELWDLMVYAMGGLEIVAWGLMIEELQNEHLHWPDFWSLVLSKKLYYRDATALDDLES